MTSSPPKAPGRPCSFDRDVALEKSLLAFWRYGYEGSSIASLTAVMGIRPPSLYAAFGDKRALFMACVQLYVDTHGVFAARALAEEPSARQAVERMLYEVAADYTDSAHPPGCLIISATAAHGPGSDGVAEELRVLREATKKTIAARIEADVRSGQLPAGTDVRSLTTFYTATVQGMSRQAQDGATRQDLERVAALAMQAWPVS